MAATRPKRAVSSVDYSRLADVQVPKRTRVHSRGEKNKLYHLRVLEEDGERVKVAYVGYGSQHNEWRPRSDIVVLNEHEQGESSSDESDTDPPLAPMKQFSLYEELAYRIKSLLFSSRKGDPVCCITMSFDSIYFDGLIRRGTSVARTARQPVKLKKYTLSSLTKLDDVLGRRWYIRGLNAAGDFCYVKPGTVNFYLKHSRGKVDYQLKTDGTFQSLYFGGGVRLVFKFIREDGTSSQWSHVLNLCQ